MSRPPPKSRAEALERLPKVKFKVYGVACLTIIIGAAMLMGFLHKSLPDWAGYAFIGLGVAQILGIKFYFLPLLERLIDKHYPL